MLEFDRNDGIGSLQSTNPTAPPPMLYELRPLSLGEILDRTFSLYRSRFWLYVGLASIASAITTIGTFVRLTWGFTGGLGVPAAKIGASTGPRQVLVSVVTPLVTGLIYFLAYSITQAATVSAVSDVYLGRTASIERSLNSVKGHWFRYFLIAWWQVWSAMWLPIALILPAFTLIALPQWGLRWLGGLLIAVAILSMLYGVIAYIRNSLGIVASVVENLKVRRAMRRSKELITGRWGRVFVLLLLMYVLNLVAGVAQGVLAIFFTMSHAKTHVLVEALTLVVTFVTGAMVAPVGAIAFCVFYIDERVRREGYDIETLMTRDPSPLPTAPVFDSPFRNSELF